MKRTITFDDLDGESEAQETIVFAIGDERYEIDLSTEHADEFTKVLEPYVNAARPYSPAASKPVKAGLTKDERAQLIEWAAANGHTVSPRGRVPSALVTAWKASLEAPSEPAEGEPQQSGEEHQDQPVEGSEIAPEQAETTPDEEQQETETTPVEETTAVDETPTSSTTAGRRRRKA